MNEQVGFSLGGVGGQGKGAASQYDAINRSTNSNIERARPLDENMKILEMTLCQLESRIELLKGKVYPIKSLAERPGPPTPCGPQTSGTSPLCNSIAEITSRIHALSIALEELMESLEI